MIWRYAEIADNTQFRAGSSPFTENKSAKVQRGSIQACPLPSGSGGHQLWANSTPRIRCLWCWLWLWTVDSPRLSPSISKIFLVYYPGIFLARFEFTNAMLARHQQEHPAAPSVGKALCSILTGPWGYCFWEGPLLSVDTVDTWSPTRATRFMRNFVR